MNSGIENKRKRVEEISGDINNLLEERISRRVEILAERTNIESIIKICVENPENHHRILDSVYGWLIKNSYELFQIISEFEHLIGPRPSIDWNRFLIMAANMVQTQKLDPNDFRDVLIRWITETILSIASKKANISIEGDNNLVH